MNNLCQQCRADADCGDNHACNRGRCEAKVAAKAECRVDADCPENHECRQGRCVAPPKGPGKPSPCAPYTVYFAFNESTLTPEATSKLQKTAECLKTSSGRRFRLEGHCDPRGTTEYNIALGDARARSVKRYLSRLGVRKDLRPVSKGELEATGTDETSWARDRKVVPLAEGSK